MVSFNNIVGTREAPVPLTGAQCDRTAQFIQVQVRLSPFNTLTRAYSHLYKPGSLASVTKDLGKSTLHQNRMIKQIHITYTEICSGNNITKEFTNNSTSLDFLN